MRRAIVFALLLGVALPCIAASPTIPSEHAPTLYERIASKLKKDPGLAKRLSAPPAELASAKWLVGTWDVAARVFATPTTPESRSVGTSRIEFAVGQSWLRFTDTYPDGNDLSFLAFNVLSRRWISVALDSTGNAVTTSASGSINRRIVFSGPPVTVMGETVVLRQTMEKRSDREYRVLNEEQLADGKWVPLDEYIYRKKSD